MSIVQQTAPVVGQIFHPARTTWWGHIRWVVAAALLGWVVTTVFAGMLQLPRALFLVPYVGLTSLLLYGYVRWSSIDVMERFRHHWGWGLIGGFCRSPNSVK
jgi:hypothetical protein